MKWLKTIKDPAPKFARWVMTLQEYDFDVEYRAGKHHQNADAMSRIHCDQVSVVSSTFLNAAVNLAEAQQEDPNISQLIGWKRHKANLDKVDRTCINKEMKCLLNQRDRLQVTDNLLVCRWKPTNQSQSEMQIVLPAIHGNEVLHQLHNCPSGGHLGVAKTAAKVQRRYYWPGWLDDVKRHVRQCEECSRRKGPK